LPWFATFRGRAGFLADPSPLLYGTAGLAVGEVKLASQTMTTAQLFGPGSQGTIPAGLPVTLVGAALNDSQTRVGWTAGVGVEKMFSRNWSAKLEYLYLDFGTKTYFAGAANQADVSFHDLSCVPASTISSRPARSSPSTEYQAQLNQFSKAPAQSGAFLH